MKIVEEIMEIITTIPNIPIITIIAIVKTIKHGKDTDSYVILEKISEIYPYWLYKLVAILFYGSIAYFLIF